MIRDGVRDLVRTTSALSMFFGDLILPRIKICENRMNEAALKVERIGEAVSIIRLRLRRVLQDCSASCARLIVVALLLCCSRAEAQGRRASVKHDKLM
jgi:hypothetical protein